MGDGAAELDAVVGAWWSVEMFNPQTIQAVAPASPDEPVISWSPARPLPWEVLATPMSKQVQWVHTVYLGVYRLRDTYEFLHKVFPPDKDVHDEDPKGESACAAVLVDQSGRPVGDSAVLSSYAWGVGRLRDPGPGDPYWLEGFDRAMCGFMTAVEELDADRIPADRERGAAPLDSDSVVKLLGLARASAGLASADGPVSDRIRIASRQIRIKPGDDPPTSDFLNSLFLEDLNRVREAIGAGQYGRALTAYLTPDRGIAPQARIDVRDHLDEVLAHTGVDQMPFGRWPAPPQHPLALSQQFAINQTLATLGEAAGLMGVNGPPGTGKTTMLRDLVAANVTERARRLAKLARPQAAFTSDSVTWKTGANTCTIRRLQPAVTGFEMVVASSNNAAVENITNELPSTAAIADLWHGRADYFSQIATEVLQAADQTRRETRSPAWGLVAARLGNAKNRNDFMNAFWFDHRDINGHGSAGMNATLKNPTGGKHPPWRQTITAFHRAEAKVNTLLDERRAAQQRISEFTVTSNTLQQLPTQAAHLHAQLDHAASDLRSLAEDQIQADHQHKTATYQYNRHYQAGPGFWETLFSLGQARAQWRAELTKLNRAIVEADDRLLALGCEHRKLLARAEAFQHQIAGLEQHRHQLAAQVDALAGQIADDEVRYGAIYPGRVWYADEDHREKHAPWVDEELATARSELFLAALDVHRAFFEHTFDVAADLGAAADVVTGRAPGGLDPDTVHVAWQLFFLAVPVVSTTFASVASMFRQLPHESIGWLLIDEAGQAAPQDAVGAMWRARSVVTVGDPLQIRPVVTVPEHVQYAIARRFDTSDTWIPKRTSVQQLTDRVAKWGTYIALTATASAGSQEDGCVWVSAPLRVHRRCDQPMFDISNEIAYDKLMINGVDLQRSVPEPIMKLPPSKWIDITSTTRGQHLQREETDWLDQSISKLVSRYQIRPDDIIAISPFRQVARQLERIADRYPGMRGGTIHTAQGREAAIVFLILGGDLNKPGAKSWVSREPNLVNVAASRAKHRLYIVGDRLRWAKHPYFNKLAATLDHIQPPPTRQVRRA